MVNVRCVVSDSAVAKIAYLARLRNLPRSQVYQDVIEKTVQGMSVENLERWIYSVETIQAGANSTTITYKPRKART